MYYVLNILDFYHFYSGCGHTKISGKVQVKYDLYAEAVAIVSPTGSYARSRVIESSDRLVINLKYHTIKCSGQKKNNPKIQQQLNHHY